ncbi:MAG: proprotein convertase P-domain-containing protein [Chitinophagaceae bacterium]|nr:proprotein convertase P-domain-containing protein [Chitinophagaceae bacterium]
MRDNANGDFGILANWSVTINYTVIPPAVWSPLTGLFTDPAGIVPYTGTAVTTVYANPATTTTYSAVATLNGCPSPAATTVITVNPVPTAVATPSTQNSCSGLPITNIVLSGTVPATTYNWTRNNTVAVTGIAASGSGNISGILTNTTSAPVTVTFTITPSTVNCTGTPITATVTVNPIPVITIAPTNTTVCAGTVTPISVVSANPGISGSLTTSSGAITVNVPDNTAAGSTATINVPALPAGAIVTGVDITINMTHTWDADMIINLKAPNGQVLNLVNARGGSGDNFTNTVISSASATSLATGTSPFTGTFAADANALNAPTAFPQTTTSFPALFGTGNGTWTLAMRDNALGDFGILTNWVVTVNYTIPPPAVWSPVTGLFLDAGMTIPYTGTAVQTIYASPNATTTYSAIATVNGCNSPPVTSVINVNPIPTAVATPSSQSICTGTAITPIVLTGAVPATTFNWTRNNTATVTGIAASGAGNITGTLTNTTASPVTVTFTITRAPEDVQVRQLRQPWL